MVKFFSKFNRIVDANRKTDLIPVFSIVKNRGSFTFRKQLYLIFNPCYISDPNNLSTLHFNGQKFGPPFGQ